MFVFELNDSKYWSFAVVEGIRNQSDEQEQILLFTNGYGSDSDNDIIQIARVCFHLGNPRIVKEYEHTWCSFLELSEPEKYAYAHWKQWNEVTKYYLVAKSSEIPSNEHTTLAEIGTELF